MPIPLASTFAAALRTARQACGWTQGELAERAGLAPEVCGRLERGRVLPRAETLVRLARVLDTTTDSLLGLRAPASSATTAAEVEAAYEEPAELRQLSARLRGSSPKTLRLLHQFVGSLERDLRHRRGP